MKTLRLVLLAGVALWAYGAPLLAVTGSTPLVPSYALARSRAGTASCEATFSVMEDGALRALPPSDGKVRVGRAGAREAARRRCAEGDVRALVRCPSEEEGWTTVVEPDEPLCGRGPAPRRSKRRGR